MFDMEQVKTYFINRVPVTLRELNSVQCMAAIGGGEDIYQTSGNFTT